MEYPFIGEIMLFAGTFTPRGWADCNGQLLSIAQNTALFSLLGTTYGGNGQNTFAVPDLRGAVPIGQGNGPGRQGYVQGQVGGTETVTLFANQLPAHTHPATLKAGTVQAPVTGNITMQVSSSPNSGSPTNSSLVANADIFTNNISTVVALNNKSISQNLTVDINPALNASTVTVAPNTGGGQPVPNMQPYVAIRYCIAVEGIYPSRP
jgi:microcystin-dependent protein